MSDVYRHELVERAESAAPEHSAESELVASIAPVARAGLHWLVKLAGVLLLWLGLAVFLLGGLTLLVALWPGTGMMDAPVLLRYGLRCGFSGAAALVLAKIIRRADAARACG